MRYWTYSSDENNEVPNNKRQASSSATRYNLRRQTSRVKGSPQNWEEKANYHRARLVRRADQGNSVVNCGGDTCHKAATRRSSEVEEELESRLIPKTRNLPLEGKAAKNFERLTFLKPTCMGWETLSKERGFSFFNGQRVPCDGRKYLVCGCSFKFRTHTVSATKLPCCSSWHFEPLDVEIHVGSKELTFSGSIDHVGICRLLDIQAVDFWNEHESKSNTSTKKLCEKIQNIMNSLERAVDTTALLRNYGEGKILISAIVL